MGAILLFPAGWFARKGNGHEAIKGTQTRESGSSSWMRHLGMEWKHGKVKTSLLPRWSGTKYGHSPGRLPFKKANLLFCPAFLFYLFLFFFFFPSGALSPQSMQTESGSRGRGCRQENKHEASQSFAPVPFDTVVVKPPTRWRDD